MMWRASVFSGPRVLWSKDFRTVRRAKLRMWPIRVLAGLIVHDSLCSRGCCIAGITWRIEPIPAPDSARS